MSATLEWEENKAVIQNLKQAVEGAAERVQDKDTAQLEVEEKVRYRGGRPICRKILLCFSM